MPQQGNIGSWAESSPGVAPGVQDSSVWGTPDWATAPAEPGSSAAWGLDLPGADLPTTGKWGEWNDFMYSAESSLMDAAQVLPRQALPGDEDLFNFRDEMVRHIRLVSYSTSHCADCVMGAVLAVRMILRSSC